ncbi:histidine phosphatase family protein [Bifidobacterium aemilianum]|uniref:Histidine phosphatase family protein n=1 Tax=Bifidobacterium aemilianum TaxID=2493120 RepID=A0A366K987_9BIFI|nr:histidine phosphatase family protein [Bifidobacterium aemilianum]RBP97201.1 histidine phosphatase family protein [Bifidobacterium aemilianum]
MTIKDNPAATEPASSRAAQPVTIYLGRHSHTTANAMGLYQGWSDFPITEKGREIIRCLGRGMRGINFTAAYCGDLLRHYETARGALDWSGNESVNISVDPDLREDNFGSFEGRDARATLSAVSKHLGFDSFEETNEKLGKDAYIKVQDAFYELDRANILGTDLDDGLRAEASDQVKERMVRAMNKVGETVARQGGGNVLVISSGLSLRHFLGAVDPTAYMNPDQPNCSVTKLVYDQGHYSIVGPIGSMEYYERGRQA